VDKSLQELLAAADAAAQIQRGGGGNASAADIYIDKAKSGLASGVGNVMDVVPRALALARASSAFTGIPQAVSAITGRPTELPEITRTGTFGTDVNTTFLKDLFGVKNLQGRNTGEKLTGALVEGGAGGLASPTGAGKSLLMDLLKSMGIGGLAGAGGEMGGQVTNDSVAGRLAGSLALGVGAPAMLSKYPAGASQLLNGNTAAAARTNAAPFVERIVEGQTKRAVQGSPDAAENITQALTLQSKLPGFKASVGEMADTPALLDMQRRYAMSSPQNLNAEAARNKANTTAVNQYFDANAPQGGAPTAVRSAVNQSVSDEAKAAQAQATAVAGRVPSTDQLALGQRMGDIAESEKAAARPAISAAYEKAFAADTSKAVDLSPVITKAEEILGTKLSQVKPESAPNTISAIQKLKPPETKPTGFGFTQELKAAQPGDATVTLRDIDGLRKAINADIAEAGRSNSPVAATQLRNLYQLHKTIDEAVMTSGLKPEAKEAYRAALEKYRTEFVPRFKEGSNLRMFQENSVNEPKILPDKFTSEYFKPDSQGGLTRASQFSNLFGKNSESLTATKAGIIDRYRDAVVDKSTGVINMAAHNKFIADHRDTLEAFKKSGVNASDDISMIGAEAAKVMNAGQRMQETAKGLKFDTVDQLVDAAIKNPRVMGNTIGRLNEDAREQFQRLLMDRARNAGGASGMSDFIAENKKTLSMALTPQHVSALEDIAKAMKIIERNPVKGSLATEGPDIVKNMTGVSTATVWAQYRATSAGRQGLATGLFNLAAPVATKLGQKEFSDIMENALHNPETAKRLRDFLLAQNAGQANMAGAALARTKEGASLLWDAKGPIARYMLGTRFYPGNIARSQEALVSDAERKGQR